ncbi:MAG: DNA methyltransferase, partial [Thermacetogeniaceae bacterium]
MATKTSSFGTSKREAHDSSAFYARKLYQGDLPCLHRMLIESCDFSAKRSIPHRPLCEWADRIYCHTSEDMSHIPDESVALAFTSPPYNSGKDYDENLNIADYFNLMCRVGSEVYRVLKPGG